MAKEMDLFQDSKTVSIEFKSTGKKVKREINAASTQTPAFKGLDSALQSVSKSDFASQTEKPSVPKISKESLSDANVVEISLFLKRVEGAMSNQLIENANSAAFDGIYSFSGFFLLSMEDILWNGRKKSRMFPCRILFLMTSIYFHPIPPSQTCPGMQLDQQLLHRNYFEFLLVD